MTKKMRISNNSNVEREVIFEPIGESYKIPAGRTMLISSDLEFGGAIEINLGPSDVSVWTMTGVDFDETLSISVDGVEKRLSH